MQRLTVAQCGQLRDDAGVVAATNGFAHTLPLDTRVSATGLPPTGLSVLAWDTIDENLIVNHSGLESFLQNRPSLKCGHLRDEAEVLASGNRFSNTLAHAARANTNVLTV